ncbi:hypothetical protein RIF29_13646 [Crotalaria pallida]|uniref:Uncharacterized protein n=1 Tax=Crotalaria pallida TaxID=3830 RepID=A0AAN9IPK5_CROPI
MKPSAGVIDYTKKFACVDRELKARRSKSQKNDTAPNTSTSVDVPAITSEQSIQDERVQPIESSTGVPAEIMEVEDGLERKNEKEEETTAITSPSSKSLPLKKRWTTQIQTDLKISAEKKGFDQFVTADKRIEGIDTDKFGSVSKEIKGLVAQKLQVLKPAAAILKKNHRSSSSRERVELNESSSSGTPKAMAIRDALHCKPCNRALGAGFKFCPYCGIEV